MFAPRIVVALVLFGALASSPPAMAQEPEKTPSQEEAAPAQEGGDEEPPPPTHRSGFERRPRFGSPNSPEGQLEDDDRIRDPVFRFERFDRAMQPYFDWKRSLDERHGLEPTSRCHASSRKHRAR